MKNAIRSPPRSGVWLLSATAFVCVCTLWPFTITAPESSGLDLRLLIVGWGKSTPLDVVNNVVLFIPWGFAFARSRGPKERRLHWLFKMMVVALVFAYSVESVQRFMPSRFSSLVDVIANTAGAAVGALLHRLSPRAGLTQAAGPYANHV